LLKNELFCSLLPIREPRNDRLDELLSMLAKAVIRAFDQRQGSGFAGLLFKLYGL